MCLALPRAVWADCDYCRQQAESLRQRAAQEQSAPAQGAYVAANAALEALARRRKAEGRSALAVAWGPIADFRARARLKGDVADG